MRISDWSSDVCSSDLIAKEEGRHNIRANSVLVGVIEAGMFLELTKRGVFDQAWIDETHKLLCLKRWGQPEDIGNAAVYLATAAYVTGQQINVSGGFGVSAPSGRAPCARPAPAHQTGRA